MFVSENVIEERTLAAPSWVFPGSIADNCAFLAGKVDEVGLLFMESASSLAYTEEDLPLSLAGLPLSWHIHLPTDLNWDEPAECAKCCLTLMDNCAFLNVKRAVLHPPKGLPVNSPQALEGLEIFMSLWEQAGRARGDILLENLPEHELAGLSKAAVELKSSICFDLSHYLIGGGTAENLTEDFFRRVRLLHLCAPAPLGKQGHHHALTFLDAPGYAAGQRACCLSRPDAVLMPELFVWTDFINSLPTVQAWLE